MRVLTERVTNARGARAAIVAARAPLIRYLSQVMSHEDRRLATIGAAEDRGIGGSAPSPHGISNRCPAS